MDKTNGLLGAVLVLCRFGSVPVYLNIGVIYMEITCI
jgi:hypothetical protein